MPRQRKTLGGDKAQPAVPVAGQEYGMGVQQMQMQKAMPMPQVQSGPRAVGDQVVTSAQQGAQSAGAAVVQAHAPMGPDGIAATHAAAMQAAQGHADQTGILTLPTQRPNEPVTAGLTRGPGPGPEALGIVHGSPAGDILRRLTASTGDPMFAELARRAGA